MRVPQVNERVKEAPASALRAMFAGIGSLLFVRDKVKSKPAPETPAETGATAPAAAAPTPAAPEAAAAPETTAAAETTPAPETTAEPATSAVPETSAAPETAPAAEATVVEETTVASGEAAPEPVVAETAAAPASEEAAALPLPNYDELSLASLRARLRNLSADQLTVLISYEQSHSGRADVISMFERRIAKLSEA